MLRKVARINTEYKFVEISVGKNSIYIYRIMVSRLKPTFLAIE